jgi:TonB family protein
MADKGSAIDQITPVEKIRVLYLHEPGPSGGGGGSPSVASPHTTELPTPAPPEVTQPSVTPMPAPVPTLNASVTTMSDLLQASGTGTIASLLGNGGRGAGDGPGEGPGVGPGRNGGTGGDVYRSGSGIKDPTLVHDQRPAYTPAAIAAKTQGVVELEVTILPDGSVDPRTIVVTRSLDRVNGLDLEAISAVKLWRFTPGVRIATGERVPVRVTIQISFTLR